MNPFPALKLEGNTFYLDNSRMEAFTRCPRRGEYAIVRARVPSKASAALFLGEVFHLAMKFRYQFYPVNVPLPKECVYKQRLLVEQCYKGTSFDETEYRTCEYCKSLITAYAREYPSEQFSLLCNPADGQPLVERSFAVKLGTINEITFVWIGRIDLGIRLPDGRPFIHDFKTSARGGETFPLKFPISSQMQGYAFALTKVLGERVVGAQISAAFTRKQTKTGKGIEFQRYRFLYDEDTLAGWQDNMLHIASDFLHCYQRGFFPMHTEQCMTEYGTCPYNSICQMSPSARLPMLASTAFQDDKWSPIHPERIDLQALYNTPLPSGWEDQMEQQAPPPEVPELDTTNMIDEILKQAK